MNVPEHMTTEQTQQQSPEDKARSKDLSRKQRKPPIEISGYSIRDYLGAGAYGEVWVGLDETTGRRVAIKFYTHRGGLDSTLLNSEVEKLVFLSADRYVVQLLDVGWKSNPPYYVMEFIEKGSLDDHLRKNGPMAVGEAVEVFREVATGLLHAHGKGVLHCDLKPANILLDQDNKPRLADFGQSRLSHEQTPALGTLFFMAPEQASLNAVPDAKWDVYALGALLYSMLTGHAPHRTERALSDIDSAEGLEHRLEKYRHFIASSKPPSAHRQIPRVDRALNEIIDRCLSVSPDRRFANIQSVLDALEARDMNRDRRPLLILGLLGPLLFLVVTALSGWRGYDRALKDSQQLLLKRAVQENAYAADFVAEAVARRIEGYVRSVETIAALDETKSSIKSIIAEHGQFLSTTAQAADVDAVAWEAFRANRDRTKLQQDLQSLVDDSNGNEIASWFVTDALGTHLAAAFAAEEKISPVGKNFFWRSYYSGLDDDIDETSPRLPDRHITDTHLSAVFKSTSTNAWKVAVSTPVVDDDGTFMGIVALTVELGRLGALLDTGENSNQQFNVLVDGREGKGYILQHPLFETILQSDQDQQLPGEFSTSDEYRLHLSHWNQNYKTNYLDPLAAHPSGVNYRNQWIAAKQKVRFDPRESGSTTNSTQEPIDTGLVVLVQENYEHATKPILNLSSWLRRLGITSFSALVAVVLTLWLLVARAMRDPNERIRRKGGVRQPPSSIHSMATIELPAKLRRDQK